MSDGHSEVNCAAWWHPVVLGNTHTDTQTSPEDAFHLFGPPQFIHAFIIIVIRIDVEKKTPFIQPHS